jgi:hypothetical protein
MPMFRDRRGKGKTVDLNKSNSYVDKNGNSQSWSSPSVNERSDWSATDAGKSLNHSDNMNKVNEALKPKENWNF